MPATSNTSFENLQSLSQILNSNQPDLIKSDSLLSLLKLEILEHAFLDANRETNHEKLFFSRTVLELGVLQSIKKKDVALFEHYLSQLKHYYFDLKNVITPSTLQYEIISSHLLCLLTQKKFSEFHVELERLDSDILSSNVYLKHVVLLEQYIVEGEANKVFLAAERLPSSLYLEFFTRELIDSMREQIANYVENSFLSLPINDAKNVLFLSSEEVLATSIKRHWEIRNDSYYFPKSVKDSFTLPSLSLLQNTISYALELDKII